MSLRGHIRKRGNTYSIVVDLGKDPITGKRKQKWFSGYKRKKDAEKALSDIISKIENGQYFEAKNITLKEYLDHWLETYAKVNVAPRTYTRYTEFANNISSYIGTIKLDKLKPALIQKYYSTLIEEGRLSKSTILKIHRMLHLALKHAVNWQVIPYNPTDAVTPPRPEKPEMKVWDIDTANRFLKEIKDTVMYIPVMLALQTGMRQGEICALKWENVNFRTGFISVVNTMQRINGQLTLKQPKTAKSIRSIALLDTTVSELKKHWKKQAELRLLFGQDYNDNGFVCCWEDGRPLDPNYVSKKFNKLVRELDFPIIRFHDLRHTHATLLLEQGVNPKIVSERLGHSQIGITLDTYSHVLPHIQKEAVKKLDNMFANEG